MAIPLNAPPSKAQCADNVHQQIARFGAACESARAGDYEQMIAIPAYVYAMAQVIGATIAAGYSADELGELTASKYGQVWSEMSADYALIKTKAPILATKIREHVPNFRITMTTEGARVTAAPVGSALDEINPLLDEILALYS